MKEAGTLNFKDADSSDDACVIVRYDETKVGFAVSLVRNGDIEVFMSKRDAKALMEVLRTAIS
jgi:hypothetical protein